MLLIVSGSQLHLSNSGGVFWFGVCFFEGEFGSKKPVCSGLALFFFGLVFLGCFVVFLFFL